MDDFPTEVVLDGVEVGVEDDAVEAADEVGHTHVKALNRGSTSILEIGVPVQVRRGFLQLGKGSHVVGLVGVAAFHAAHRVFGQFGLKGEDALGLVGSGFRLSAGELKHLGDVLDILVAHFLGLFGEVVVLVGEAQAALVEVHDVLAGVFRVEARTGIEEAAEAVLVQVAKEGGQLGLVVELFDLLEVGQKLSVAALVDGHGVHAGIVEVADFLCHAALGGVGIVRGFIDDVLDELFVALVDFGEGSEGGVFFRNRVVFQPVVVGIAEEVVRRIDGSVHVTQLDGWNHFFLGLGCFDCFFSAACCHCA